MAPAATPQLNAGMILVALFGLGVIAAVVGSWTLVIARLAMGLRVAPDAPARPAPWGFFSVVLIIVLRVLIEVLTLAGYLPLAYGRSAFRRDKSFELSPFDQMTLVAVVNLALLFLVPSLLRLTSGARPADLGLPGRPIGLNLFRGATLCFLLLPGVYAVMLLATLIWKANQHPAALTIFNDPSLRTVALTFLSGVLLAPAAEELLFRGVLLGWLTRVWYKLANPASSPPRAAAPPDPGLSPVTSAPEVGAAGLDSETRINASVWEPPVSYPEGREVLHDWDEIPAAKEPTPDPVSVTPPSPARRVAGWLPNILTSLVFAALHFPQWPAPIPLFLLSLFLGTLYRRTGSLVAPIAMHTVFNGLSMTGLLLITLAGLKPPESPPKIPPPAAVVWVQGVIPVGSPISPLGAGEGVE